jgi:predicted house-cleaning noncanonical NTP pyrophosphatase (MazG superfamily)
MSDYVVKLVRDRIPEIVPPDGVLAQHGVIRGALDYVELGHANHVRWLRKKIGEEVLEYLMDPSVGELADILEAVWSLATVDLGVSFEAVLEAAVRKRRERGGFTGGVAMVCRA